jgi:acyl carrier protein
MSLRDQLLTTIESWNLEVPDGLQEDTPLIASGLFDSLALFNLTIWIEQQLGRPVDPTAFDLTREWATIGDVVRFVEDNRE